MSAKQYLALSVQPTSRDALAETPTFMFYPVKGAIEPTAEFKEDSASEWRGQDTAQGNTGDNEERTSTSWKFAWDSRIYPGDELAILFKYLFGYQGTPAALSAPNAAASAVIYKSTSEMYGEGTTLLDTAIALHPNTRKGANTYSQDFIGGRIKDGEFSFKGGEAAEMKLNFIGGPWIGDPEQTATAGLSFPAAKAFKSVPKLYIGPGATLTGSAGARTDFAPGTMKQAKPDDLTIKIDPGIDDVYKMNGFEGPSVTERKGMVNVTVEFTIDFSDPASLWSSYDAWAARFAGLAFVPAMIVLDSSELIPDCTTQGYGLAFYLPKMKITNDAADRKNDGSKDKIKFKLESRVDVTENVAAYAKLIY